MFALRHLFHTPSMLGHRIGILSDIMSLVLGASKRRGSRFVLNSTRREITALALLGGLSVHLRWVSSRWNPADEPSRLRGPSVAAAAPSPPSAGRCSHGRRHSRGDGGCRGLRARHRVRRRRAARRAPARPGLRRGQRTRRRTWPRSAGTHDRRHDFEPTIPPSVKQHTMWKAKPCARAQPRCITAGSPASSSSPRPC